MFPLTHLYLLSELTPLENLAVQGSLFPDTCIAGHLSWDDTHKSGLDYIRSLSPPEKEALKPFLTGLLAHGVDPPGLDYYCDESLSPGMPGYAFIKGPAIISDVILTCNLPDELGLWKAHNVIEMAVEVRIGKMMPSLMDALDSGFDSPETLSLPAYTLGRYYNISPGDIVPAYEALRGFIPQGIPDEENLGAAFINQLEHKHGVKGVSPEKTAELIRLADSHIADDFMEFLESCREKIFASLPLWLGEKES